MVCIAQWWWYFYIPSTFESFADWKLSPDYYKRKNLLLEEGSSQIFSLNPFIPQFLKWTLPSLNLDMSTVAKKGFHSKIKKNRVANSVDPDETACYELSHLDLHCLHPQFLKWTLPSLNLDMSTVAKKGFHSKIKKNRVANSVDPDEMACYELSHLDLHCLHLFITWFVITQFWI